MEAEEIYFLVSSCCMFQSNRAMKAMTVTAKETLNYSGSFLEWKNGVVDGCLEQAAHHSLRALWPQF